MKNQVELEKKILKYRKGDRCSGRKIGTTKERWERERDFSAERGSLMWRNRDWFEKEKLTRLTMKMKFTYIKIDNTAEIHILAYRNRGRCWEKEFEVFQKRDGSLEREIFVLAERLLLRKIFLEKERLTRRKRTWCWERETYVEKESLVWGTDVEIESLVLRKRDWCGEREPDVEKERLVYL